MSGHCDAAGARGRHAPLVEVPRIGFAVADDAAEVVVCTGNQSGICVK